MFAETTKSTYSSQFKSFINFCRDQGLQPVPANNTTLTRYVAFLARTKVYSTIMQYLNIIRIIHLECGIPNPLRDNWYLKSVTQGIKRGKGNTSNQKTPILPQHLLYIYKLLNVQHLKDLQIWATILCAFFGLLRIGNITCSKQPNCIHRSDVTVTPKGLILKVTYSKTIQYRERCHYVVLPYIKGHPLCPTSPLLRFMSLTTSCSDDVPLFSIPNVTGKPCSPLTTSLFRRRLSGLTSKCPGLSGSSTHSLRRGGATWLLTSGVPVATIKILGDWKSDAIFKYLLPDTNSKFQLFTIPCSKLQKTTSTT